MSGFAHDSDTWGEVQMRKWFLRQTGAHVRAIAAALGLPTTRRPGRVPIAALVDSIVAERQRVGTGLPVDAPPLFILALAMARFHRGRFLEAYTSRCDPGLSAAYQAHFEALAIGFASR